MSLKAVDSTIKNLLWAIEVTIPNFNSVAKLLFVAALIKATAFNNESGLYVLEGRRIYH